MLYAKVENGSIVQYPYEIDNLRKDNPGTSFPHTSMENANTRSNYGVVEVAEESHPRDNSEQDGNGVVTKYSDTVIEGAPIKVNGDWKQVWEQTPKTELERHDQARKFRLSAYGSPETQIEFLTENGLEAWQDKVSEIKSRYPKL